MDRLGRALADYLQATGGDQPARLGAAPAAASPETEKAAGTLLLSQLQTERSFNRNMLVVVASLHLLIFVMGVFLVASNWDSPTTAGLLFGGTSLSLMAVVTKLRNLWAQKVEIDLLIAILPGLSARDRLSAVQSVFHRHHGRRPTRQKGTSPAAGAPASGT